MPMAIFTYGPREHGVTSNRFQLLPACGLSVAVIHEQFFYLDQLFAANVVMDVAQLIFLCSISKNC